MPLRPFAIVVACCAVALPAGASSSAQTPTPTPTATPSPTETATPTPALVLNIRKLRADAHLVTMRVGASDVAHAKSTVMHGTRLLGTTSQTFQPGVNTVKIRTKRRIRVGTYHITVEAKSTRGTAIARATLRIRG